MGKIKPIRGVYGKPWSKMAQIEPSPEILLQMGEIIVEEISKEARKDFARTGKTPRGVPMSLPNTRRFFDSFSVSILGASTIVISTSWEWFERHVEGRKPYKMPWLTQERGVFRVPITQEDGSVRIVATPATEGEAWIHPGVKKFNFLARGVKKGRIRAAKLLAVEAIQQVLGSNPLK